MQVIDDEKNVNETSAEEKVDQAEPRSAPIPPKKKRPTDQKLDLLKQSYGILKAASDNVNSLSNQMSIQNEEVRYFCGFIGNKMSKYSDITRASVQHAIHNIIFQADRGFYEATYTGNMHYMGPSTSTTSFAQHIPNTYSNNTNSFFNQLQSGQIPGQHSSTLPTPTAEVPTPSPCSSSVHSYTQISEETSQSEEPQFEDLL